MSNKGNSRKGKLKTHPLLYSMYINQVTTANVFDVRVTLEHPTSFYLNEDILAGLRGEALELVLKKCEEFNVGWFLHVPEELFQIHTYGLPPANVLTHRGSITVTVCYVDLYSRYPKIADLQAKYAKKRKKK